MHKQELCAWVRSPTARVDCTVSLVRLQLRADAGWVWPSRAAGRPALGGEGSPHPGGLGGLSPRLLIPLQTQRPESWAGCGHRARVAPACPSPPGQGCSVCSRPALPCPQAEGRGAGRGAEPPGGEQEAAGDAARAAHPDGECRRVTPALFPPALAGLWLPHLRPGTHAHTHTPHPPPRSASRVPQGGRAAPSPGAAARLRVAPPRAACSWPRSRASRGTGAGPWTAADAG